MLGVPRGEIKIYGALTEPPETSRSEMKVSWPGTDKIPSGERGDVEAPMPKIYVGDLDDPDALAESLEGCGYEVVREKTPDHVDPEDLSVVPAKAGITSSLRHAVNNPLTAVLGYTQLLLRKEELPPDISDKLKKVHEHAQRVRDLVRSSDGYHA